MKLPAPYKCDYCGKLKGEANHWCLRLIESGSFWLHAWDDRMAEKLAASGQPMYEHICGATCAGRAMDRWMNSASMEPTPEAPQQ